MKNQALASAPDRILRVREVVEVVGLSKSQLYRLFAAGEFPAPVKLSARARGWRSSAIHKWVASRVDGETKAYVRQEGGRHE